MSSTTCSKYRDDEIRLQVWRPRSSLPANVYLIGTMNTADRSIALLDAALRRRFHFVPFFPDQAPVAGLLRRWLERHRPEMAYVAELVDRANSLLPDRHLQVGPSHLMSDDADWLHRIWKFSVIPYIEEQFFDEPERVAAFQLSRLQGETNDGDTEDGGDEAEPTDAGAAGMGPESPAGA